MVPCNALFLYQGLRARGTFFTMKTLTNSLGLEFASAPPLKNILFGKWLTRVKDFRAFVQATGYDATQDMRSLKTDGWKPHGDTWEHPGFPQTDGHPVCGVSWQDAQAFCEWLTEKEHGSGQLPAGWPPIMFFS